VAVPADAVARVGDRFITEAEVRSRLAAAAPGTPPGDVWNELLVEALIDAAVAIKHPRTLDVVKQVRVDRYLREEIGPRLTKDKVPEEPLRTVYERSKHLFVHGRLVKADVIAFYTGPNMRAEPKQLRKETAAEMAQAFASIKSPTDEDFARIVAEPKWRAKPQRQVIVFGAEPFFSPEVNQRFVDVLRKPGDFSGLVAAEPAGYFFARYLDEQPPKNETFAMVKDKLAEGFFDTWRHQEFVRIADALALQHKVEEYPDVLMGVLGPGARTR